MHGIACNDATIYLNPRRAGLAVRFGSIADGTPLVLL